MTGRHLFIPLEIDNENYYASCNIVNDESLIYVCLLHPKQGSLLFTLNFDESSGVYKSRFIVPGLDQLTLQLLNEKLMEDDAGANTGLYEKNYRIIENDDEYGYAVINRLYKRAGEGIAPTGKFHVFYEGWKEFGEYEWGDHGFISAKGTLPDEKEIERINGAIEKMNAG